MSQPLANDPPSPRSTRVQASLRRRAYRRGRAAGDGASGNGQPPLDELDEVDEPDAAALAAEEELEALEALEEQTSAEDEAVELLEDDLDLAGPDDDDVDDLEVVETARGSDDLDDDDDLPGGGDPERYDDIELEAVATEPEVETLDDLVELEPDEDLDDEDLDGEDDDDVAELVTAPIDDDLDDDELGAVAVVPAARSRSKKRYVPARRVRRTIRRIDPISLAKLALVFNLCFLAMTLVAGVIIWLAASASGSIDNIESFVEDIGFEEFQIRGGQLLRGLVLGGLVLSVAGTFFAFIMGVLFNLLSDLVGGIRITMVEPDESA
jgi:hypothetical protein